MTQEGWSVWRRFLLALLAANLVAAGLYLTVGRSWVERRYAHTRATHPIHRYVVIDGKDFVPLTDGRLLTIGFWEAVLVSILALLRHAARGRGPSRAPALGAATVLSLLFVGEVGVRIYHKRTHGLPYLLPLQAFYDPVLGWKGKQVFGDLHSPKPRILVLGDSFTDGLGFPEGVMYYASLKRDDNPELFVYAGGGYGTLQELLVLERYFDEVRPDLVVLQTCSNDFINNSYAIESASYWSNNLMVRPFLEDGVIRYRYPKLLGPLRPSLANTSRLAYELFLGVDHLEYALMNKGFLSCIECRINQGEEREVVGASVRTTGLILDRFRARLGSTRAVAFSVDLLEPFESAFARLFRERNIPFLEDPARAVAAAEAGGARLRIPNGHFNEEGNRILGEALEQALVRIGELPVKPAS